MFNIVVQNKENLLLINYFFIFCNCKIILVNDLKDKISLNENYIFINKSVYPKKGFLNNLKKIFSDNLDFCYLSDTDDVFIVNQKNIIIQNNEMDIKKTNKRIILFNKNSNPIDNIIPPVDINYDYVYLLKHKTYDSKINQTVAYKAYEKFLKYQVKENYCYNFVIYVTDINKIKTLILPNYNFYRITIFHNFKTEEELLLLKGFCKKNKILSCFYSNTESINICHFNNLRSIWFEKIVLVKDINYINNETINLLNKYHKYYENIVLENVMSIKTPLFVLMPYMNDRNIDYKLYNLIESYLINKENCYFYKKYPNKYKLVFKELTEQSEKQMLLVRDYVTLTNNIIEQIKNNYDVKKLGQLLLKKVSIGCLCKDEKELLKDIDMTISGLNSPEILNDLVMLFANIKNKEIMSKLYIKMLKIGMETKINFVTIKCFQNLLAINTNEETNNVILDFFDFIYSKNLIKEYGLNENNIKMILMSMFYTITKFLDNKIIMDKFVNLTTNFFNLDDLSNIDKILELEKHKEKIDQTVVNISLSHFLIFKTTEFSAYYSTNEEFLNKRKEIKNNIINLLNKNLPTCNLNSVLVFPINNFYLAYQGIPSVDLFTLKTKLIRKLCPELNYKIDTNFTNKKINICFHSNFLTRWHSVFKDRHQIIKALAEKEEYNVYFSTFDPLNDDVKYLFGKAKHIKLGNKSLKEISELYTSMKLDVLVYCEIGMDPKSYFLAFMKLAKIQINTWGHSDSSGIDTIDYFFSSKLYELPYEIAQTHYSEKLILQNSLCTSYINPSSRHNILKFKNRYEYGFTDEVTIFFCAQSLFKFNPVFDNYIIEILEKNPNFILIILNNESKQKVIKRFNNKNITSRIHIFQGMDHFSYLNLMNISDIILDPYPFGGCNSSLEAFSLGKIVITHASDMINGRFTTGFYKKMGLDNLITTNKDDYVNLAITFATDKVYKESIEKQIKEKSNVLFNDQESIQEWDNDIKKIIYNNI